MTMVRLHNYLVRRAVRVAGLLLGVGLALCVSAATANAQSPPVHFQHAGVMPPGAIGSMRLQQGGPLSGYIQPVEIRAPSGAQVSVVEEGRFSVGEATPLNVGLLIAPVYRLKVTHIPTFPGIEVYPTIEVIDRLFPPAGEKWRFPIPIELTQTELELAMQGKFITRVIYLENPQAAMPHAKRPGVQEYFEVAPHRNPLEVADELGRPVAILRMGGRVPAVGGADQSFLFGSPPLMRGNELAARDTAPHSVDAPLPRIPLPQR